MSEKDIASSSSSSAETYARRSYVQGKAPDPIPISESARAASQRITDNERQIFDYLLRPDDLYTADGVYWADLPLAQRYKFVSHVDGIEARRELGIIGRMFKADPLSPVRAYFRNMVIPGAGLGLEGYVLFSIGNIKPLFQATGSYPTCWKTHTECNSNWTAAVDYLEIIGIIFGQILVGVIGDWLGRRWGLIQDAMIMLFGLIMLTAAWGTSLNGWVICYAWSLFVYSIGVGGEYPMTATSGMENAVGAGKISTREDRLHRGRKVTSAFLMQGWGQLANQALLIVLLIIFNSGTGDAPYLRSAVQWTYRLSFAIPAIGTLWLLYYRTYKMRDASRQLALVKKNTHVTGYDVASLKLAFSHFGFRILATAGGWFANDVFFYGNKLFASDFLKVINPETSSVMPNWIWNLVNVIVSLCGYYLASFLIDNKLYGRKMMQQIGFGMDFILFIIPATHLKYYTSPAGVKSFQTMYFLSSFFNQFGPNAVTFLVAAEVFPTGVRATAHGFSAAWGKAGALLAAVLYNYIDDQTKFYVVPWFGLLGMLLTFFFLPDTTGLDLQEQERRWAFIRQGRPQDYHGIAVHSKHLSLWERWRGVGRSYDPELDYRQKIDEMRGEWEAEQAAKFEERDRDRHGQWDVGPGDDNPGNGPYNGDNGKNVFTTNEKTLYTSTTRSQDPGIGLGAEPGAATGGNASTGTRHPAASVDTLTGATVFSDQVNSYYQSTRTPLMPAAEKDVPAMQEI